MKLSGLIVGLGNPGKEYDATRHNYGFMVIEALLRSCEAEGQVDLLSSRKDSYHLWRFRAAQTIFSDPWLFCTPLTFMNRSGLAVQQIAAYYHIDISEILIAHDELDLPLGRLKLQRGGGNAGHNGIRSIQQSIGSKEFYRLRLGLGKPKGFDGASFVLSRFAAQEHPLLDECTTAAVHGLQLFMSRGPVVAQQYCNGFIPENQQPSSPENSDRP